MDTVRGVFDRAIHLMDAQNESTGSTRTTDTHEYELRTPNIINVLLDQVYPYSGTYPDIQEDDGTALRPALDSVESLEDTLDLDPYICRNVLPFGLAGLLLTEENPTQANFFWQTYLENLNMAKSRLPSSGGIEAIEDVYGNGGPGGIQALGWGGIEFGQFGRW